MIPCALTALDHWSPEVKVRMDSALWYLCNSWVYAAVEKQILFFMLKHIESVGRTHFIHGFVGNNW